MRLRTDRHRWSLVRALLTLASAGAVSMGTIAAAQEPPPVAMRPVDVRRDAIVNATVVAAPGERIADAAVLLKDGWIERVGPRGSFEIPAGTTVHDAGGAFVYAGFIDACVRVDGAAAAKAAAAEAGAHWNVRVTPQVRAADLPALGADARKALRALGFTAAAIHPDSGIFRGGVQVSLLGDDPRAARTVVADAGTGIAFETTGGRGGDEDDEESWNRATYPGALIGSIALVRQTLADAAWHARCVAAWKANPSGNDPPQLANALEALAPAVRGERRAWFDASDERNLLRAERIAREHGLDAGFVGSGREYRALAEVKAAGRPVVVPFDFPKAPDLATPRAADAVPLRELLHWAFAPANLAELLRAGVPAAASTVRLRDVPSFAKAARRAMDCGTTEDELLAALTVNPARMLGLGGIAGEVRAGHMANLVVCEGPIYGEDSKVRDVWVAGMRHEVEPRARFPHKGEYRLGAPDEGGGAPALPEVLVVNADERTVAFRMPMPAKAADQPAEAPASGDAKPPAAGEAAPQGGEARPGDAGTAPDARPPGRGGRGPKPEEVRGEGTNFEDSRAGFALAGKAVGGEGSLRGTIVATKDAMQVALTRPDGSRVAWTVPATARSGDAPDPKADREKPKKPDVAAVLASVPRTRPFGDMGVDAPFAPAGMLVEHATVWTAGKDGILQDADVLVRGGKIAAVGRGLRAGIPAAGK